EALSSNTGTPDPDDWEPDRDSKNTKSKERINQVLDEIKSSQQKDFTSKVKLSQDEALEVGKKWLEEGYREVGRPGDGVFRSADGLRQFRIDKNSILGKHDPYEPHIHLEKFDISGKKLSNCHIIFGN
ncbi:MAG: hypothetical protein AABY27_00765, partial [Pseudomonadota bacterium]